MKSYRSASRHGLRAYLTPANTRSQAFARMLDAAPVWLIDLTASLRVLLTLRTTTWYLHLVRAVVDAAGDRDPIPRTMSAYELRGTPTLILIDRKGFLRYHAFGQAPDLAVGAAIAQLLAEAVA